MRTDKREMVLVQLSGKVVGPYPVDQLSQLKGFTTQTLVSYPGTDKWAAAYRVLKIQKYEPPAAYTPDSDHYFSRPTRFALSDYAPATPNMRIIHGPVSKHKSSHSMWVDTWFRRMAIFNGLILIYSLLVWNYMYGGIKIPNFSIAKTKPASVSAFVKHASEFRLPQIRS